MKLISMTCFVLEQSREAHDIDQFADRVECYANFLIQKLELWMFVPCKLVEGIWVVLEEPLHIELYEGDAYDTDVLEYQEAKNRMLFEGFEYDKRGFAYSTTQSECGFDEEYMDSKTIEDLVKYNLELTPTAQKQIVI